MAKTFQKRSPNGSPRRQTTMRMQVDLIERLQEVAEREDRSFGNVVERLLVAGLAKMKKPRDDVR